MAGYGDGDLPMTGSTDFWWLVVIGVVILVAGIVLWRANHA